MTTRHPLTVSLTPELAHFVATEVRSGQYGSASEVIREGLRLLATARHHVAMPPGEGRGVPKHVGLRAIRGEVRRG